MQSPGWYTTHQVGQPGVDEDKKSKAGMISDESSVTCDQLVIVNFTYDQASRVLEVHYSDVIVPGKVELFVTGFRNPVNLKPVTGFYVKTLNKGRDLIEES